MDRENHNQADNEREKEIVAPRDRGGIRERGRKRGRERERGRNRNGEMERDQNRKRERVKDRTREIGGRGRERE